MKIIKIRAEKQDNGLWGTPLSCYSIDKILFNCKMELHSALIMAISETWTETFKIYNSNKNGFMLKIDNSRVFFVQYHKYELIDNTLYEFESEKEHTTFLRKNKIKNINERMLCNNNIL